MTSLSKPGGSGTGGRGCTVTSTGSRAAQGPRGRASLPVGVGTGSGNTSSNVKRGGGARGRGGSGSGPSRGGLRSSTGQKHFNTEKSALASAKSKPLPPETSIVDKSAKFEWKVNEPNGYFELGKPSQDDDLYVLNITIVAAEYLHFLLRDEESYLRDTYLWTVTYNAFGCDISSDNFQLPGNNESRRAFIGDRATARIRTNGAKFNEYLSDTSLEFQVHRSTAITGNDKLMGVSFLDLKDLSDPEVNCMKCTLEIVPVGPIGSSSTSLCSRLRDKKPEVRVIIDMNVIPNYFANHNEEDAGLVSGESFARKESSATIAPVAIPLPTVQKPPELVTIDSEDESSSPGSISNIGDMDVSIPHRLDILNTSKDERPKLNDQFTPLERSIISDGAGDEVDTSKGQRKKSELLGDDGNALTKDVEIITIHSPPKHQSRSIRTNIFESSETEPSVTIPPGTYKVEIELREMRLKTRKGMTSDLLFSLTYPPLGIPRTKPVFCKIDKDEFHFSENDASRKYARIRNGTWQLIAQLGAESLETLKEPIIIETSHESDQETIPFGLIRINFTDVFLSPLLSNKRQLRGEAELVRRRDNTRIGCLLYTLRVQETRTIDQSSDEEEGYTSSVVEDSNSVVEEAEDGGFGHSHARCFPPSVPPPPVPSTPQGIDSMDGQSGSKTANVDKIENNWQSKIEAVTKNDLQSWKNSEMARFREDLKKKESAYLRILSEEWTKRDVEREKQTSETLHKYEQQLKSTERKQKKVDKMERELQQREIEIGNIVQQKTIEHSKVVEEIKLRLRQAKAEYASEIKNLQNRIEYLVSERDKYKSKVMTIEARLQTKEHEIEKLLNARAQWPDLQVERKLIVAEDKLEQLSEKLARVTKERDDYKSYADKLSKRHNQLHLQRDAELQHENSNLRAQLVATHYKKSLFDERKTIGDISEQLKSLSVIYDRRKRNEERAGNANHNNPPIGVLHTHFSPSSSQKNRHGHVHSQKSNCPRSRNYVEESDQDDEEEDPNGNLSQSFNRTLDIGHLTPLFIKSMSEKELDDEICRVTKERNRMKDYGLNRSDPKLREIENLLTRLASQRQALQLKVQV